MSAPAPIPFSRPWFPGGEDAALAEVVASGWVAQGPRVQAFERAWAQRAGAAHAVATTNGTTALQLALWAAGIGPGDEVIVPSLSFIATANAVWHCGATPVFADVDPATLNLDPAAAEAVISERTAAIMPVDQLGLPADLDAFAALAERHGLKIVEDAACAMGARWRGRPIGSFPWPACFSLHARKVITTGEGGMVTTGDGDQADRLRRLRHHGMDLSDLARHQAQDVVFEAYVERAWNARMTDMQAALGLCQLDALDEILARRRHVAERYGELLAGLDGVTPPAEPAGAEHTWQSYGVRLDDGIDRLEVMRGMLRDEIATRRGPTAIHEERAYDGVETAPLPHTEAAARRVLLLPIFPALDGEQQERVAASLARHVRRAVAVS
jgi:dTDP-4-amino-4,6-dideoxygalactose transaminase